MTVGTDGQSPVNLTARDCLHPVTVTFRANKNVNLTPGQIFQTGNLVEITTEGLWCYDGISEKYAYVVCLCVCVCVCKTTTLRLSKLFWCIGNSRWINGNRHEMCAVTCNNAPTNTAAGIKTTSLIPRSVLRQKLHSCFTTLNEHPTRVLRVRILVIFLTYSTDGQFSTSR
jgi:hypothetical protein